jgi:hypothetical protein
LQGLGQVFVLSVVVESLEVLEFLFRAPKLLVLFTKFKAECLLELSANKIFILEEPPVDFYELVHLLNGQASGELASKVLEFLGAFGPEGVDVVSKREKQCWILDACDLLPLNNPTVDGV